MRYFILDNVSTEEELEDLIATDWKVDKNDNVYYEFATKEEMLNSLEYQMQVDFMFSYPDFWDENEDDFNDNPHYQKFKSKKLERLEREHQVSACEYDFYIIDEEEVKEYV